MNNPNNGLLHPATVPQNDQAATVPAVMDQQQQQQHHQQPLASIQPEPAFGLEMQPPLHPLGTANPYSSSGFDILSLLALVLSRPNPQYQIGSVDLSCAFCVTSARSPSHPIVYCSETFELLTGYTRHMIQGQNCRFLQSPDGKMAQGEPRRRDDVALPARLIKDRLTRGLEVQTKIVNFRRGGSPFVNFVTIIPIRLPRPDTPFLQPDTGIDYMIGFQVDVNALQAPVPTQLSDGSFAVSYQRSFPIPRLLPLDPEPNSDQDAAAVATATMAQPHQSASADQHLLSGGDVSALLHNLQADLSDPSRALASVSGHVWGRVLLEFSRVPVLVLSASGSVQYASPALADMLAYPRSSHMVGLPLARLCHRSDVAAFSRALRETTAPSNAALDGPGLAGPGQWNTVDLICRFRKRGTNESPSQYIWTHSLGSVHSSVGTAATSSSSNQLPRAGWARRHVIFTIRPIRTYCLSRGLLLASRGQQETTFMSNGAIHPSRYSQPFMVTEPTLLNSATSLSSPYHTSFPMLNLAPPSFVADLSEPTEAGKSIWFKLSLSGIMLFVPSNLSGMLKQFAIPIGSVPHTSESAPLRQLLTGSCIQSLLRPLCGSYSTGLDAVQQGWNAGQAHAPNPITAALESLEQLRRSGPARPIPCLLRHRWRRAYSSPVEGTEPDNQAGDKHAEDEELQMIFGSGSYTAQHPLPIVFLSLYPGDAASPEAVAAGQQRRPTFAIGRIQVLPNNGMIVSGMHDLIDPLQQLNSPDGPAGFLGGTSLGATGLPGGLLGMPPPLSVPLQPAGAGGVHSSQSPISAFFPPNPLLAGAGIQPSTQANGALQVQTQQQQQQQQQQQGHDPFVTPVTAPTTPATVGTDPTDPGQDEDDGDDVFAPEIAPGNPASWQYEFRKLRLQNDALARERAELRARLDALRSGSFLVQPQQQPQQQQLGQASLPPGADMNWAVGA